MAIAPSLVAIVVLFQFCPGRSAVVWSGGIVPSLAPYGMAILYLGFVSKVTPGVALTRFFCLWYSSVILPLALHHASLPRELLQQQRAQENVLENRAALSSVWSGLMTAAAVLLLRIFVRRTGCPQELTYIGWLTPHLATWWSKTRHASVVTIVVSSAIALLSGGSAMISSYYGDSVGPLLLDFEKRGLPSAVVSTCRAFPVLSLLQFFLSFMRAVDETVVELGTNVRGGRTGTLSDSAGLVAILGWCFALIFLTA